MLQDNPAGKAQTPSLSLEFTDRRKVTEETMRLSALFEKHQAHLDILTKRVQENTELSELILQKMEIPFQLIEGGASFFKAVIKITKFIKGVVYCFSSVAKKLLPILLLFSASIALLVQFSQYDIGLLLRNWFGKLWP